MPLSTESSGSPERTPCTAVETLSATRRAIRSRKSSKSFREFSGILDMEKKTDFDALIIGGGPCGATAGAVLAEHGHDVLILEREKFPRYHIGESLLPF